MIFVIGERLKVLKNALSYDAIDEGIVELVEYMKEDEDDMIPYRVAYTYLDDDGNERRYDEWLHEEDIIGYATMIRIGGE